MIHLDECDPEGKGWKQMPYAEATDYGCEYADLCPNVEYMRYELFQDELVWVED